MKSSIPSMCLLVAVAVASPGCSLLKSIVKAKKENEVEDLEAAGDYEGLQALCSDGRNSACKAKQRVGSQRLEASSCAELVPNIEKYYVNHDGTRDGDTALVQRLHECEQHEALFAKSLRIRWLSQALATADSGGSDLFTPFVEHLEQEQSAYAGTAGTDQLRRLSEWLITVGDASRCPKLDAQYDHIAEESRGWMLQVYYEVGCGPEAVPHARDNLQSEGPWVRVQACDILGKYGDATDVETLEILATTDGYKEEREIRTASGGLAIEVYHPVRERCQAAAGKIKVRGA